ncbi:MAG: ABC transporter ATP-binding protein [Geminicoccaceae bacterium]
MSRCWSWSGIERRFRQGATTLPVLRGADLTLAPGELVALVGPSGSGKSTLLHIAALLERPSAGEVTIDGRACGRLGDRERTGLRRNRIGFVYQFHHLLADFTALENAMLPQLLAGRSRAQAKARAADLLGRLGLGERLGHRPGRLSGGEQQRVAIARALANRPGLLLADEPTGNLDPATSARVLDLLVEVVRETGTAGFIATHNPDIAAAMDRTLELVDGRLRPGRRRRRPARGEPVRQTTPA